jgi:hypothetical protein
MADPAPRNNVMAANANNGGGGANAAVIGNDAAAPFPLAASAGRGPVPGGHGGGRGHGRGCGGSRAAAHPGSGPRFTTAELEHLNESVESVLPLGPMEWEEVAELHAELYPTLNHCSTNLKCKFKEMYNSTVPTGDPTCPPHIQRAKQIFILIQDRSDANNLEGELPDIGIEIDDLNNVNNEGAQVNNVQEETEDEDKQHVQGNCLKLCQMPGHW